MTDSMKFGPEWLRNMSSDIGGGGQGGQTGGGLNNMFGQNNNINSGSNNNSSNNISSISAPRYQLAEYRYGREEMLSLCEKVRIPEILPKYKKLFVEKLNGPLALTPSTEDDAVSYERTPWPVRGVPPSVGISSRGARGGSIERGRGRGRGSYHSTLGYQRSSSMYDEDARGGGRATWLERNGDAAEWNGGSSTSPRKEYITRNSSMESWRRSRDDDSTSTTSTSTTTIASDTWRGIGPGGAPTGYKWARSHSWRDEDSSLSHNNNDGRSFNSNSISERGSIGVGGKPSLAGTRKSMHTWNDDENLPEWAMEDQIEGGGSFDSSGAFHGTQDEDDPQAVAGNEKTVRKPSIQTDDSSQIKKESSVEPARPTQTNSQKPNQTDKLDTKDNKVDGKIVPTNEADKWRSTQVERNENLDSQNKKDATVEDCNKENSSATVNMAVDSKKESSMSNVSQNQSLTSDSVITSSMTDDSQNQQQSLVQSMLQSQQKQHHKLSRPPMSESASVDRMQEVADDMVEKLIMDDEMCSGERDISGATNLLRKKSDSMPPHQLHKDSQQYPVQSDLWLYRDPQGKVQGPFSATEMTEWYRAGYFDENLYVRQVFDSRFSALGDLVKQRGGLPFCTPAALSHNLKNDLSASHAPHEIPHSNIPQAKSTTTPTPMLPNDGLPLEYQFHLQQNQYLLQKHALIMKSLTESDPWPLLSTEQQANMINQRMAEITIPEYLMPPASMNNKQSLGMPPNLSHKPILKQQQSPVASSHQHFDNHDFIASNVASSDSSSAAAIRSLMQQISLNQHQAPLPMPMQHQPTPQPSTPNPYNAIQSLMMQLAMQKGSSSGSVAMQTSGQHSLDKSPSNNGGWMGTNVAVSPNLSQPSANSAASSWATNRIWPIPMPPLPITHKQPTSLNQQQQQQMKTEKQIREELKKEEQQNKDDLVNWKIPNLTVQQQFVAQQQAVQQQQQQQQQVVQQQMLEKQTFEKQRQEKQKRDADSEKKSKAEEEKQKQLKKEASKLDGASLKKDTKADDKKKESDEKKRQKELKKQQVEDERRRQQEEEKRRQYIEEKKRLEDIAEQRKAKLMEGQRRSQQIDQQRQNANPSVAPWSIPVAQVAKTSLSLAEIQKAERERRAEQSRIEQLIREQQQTQNLIESQQQKESSQKWNLQPHSVKSLAEIQAEESKRQGIADQIALNAIATANTSTKKREVEQAQQHFASIWNTNTAAGPIWNSAKMWSNGSSTSSGGFWEEPIKTNNIRLSNSTVVVSSGSSVNASAGGSKVLIKSQTVSNMQQAAAKSTSKMQPNATKPIAKANSTATVSGSGLKTVKSGKKDREASENSNHEFNVWCYKALAAHEKVIDVPTFVTFLRDLESPFEVKDYIRMYLGETKECTEFAKQFLERRSKYKNQQRVANAHIDDMCSPAPAITPSNDFQEVKGKGKKEKKKNKMLKLDSRILGFSVTAAQDRLNVGDRDYGYGEAP